MGDVILQIENLHASVDGTEILRGIDLTVRRGEVHAIMGANGSGKSTLCNVLAGRAGYTVTAGRALYDGKDLLELDPAGARVASSPSSIGRDSRRRHTYFLRTALNALRAPARNRSTRWISSPREAEIASSISTRSPQSRSTRLRAAKKRNESSRWRCSNRAWRSSTRRLGLDIDALKIVADSVTALRNDRTRSSPSPTTSAAEHLVPDFVTCWRRAASSIGRQASRRARARATPPSRRPRR